jgi:ligand-binding SRPBCC domain-containing protein
MKVHVLDRRQSVAADLDTVFAFFSRPENLARITPPSMRFQVLTPSPIPMHRGALIDYVVTVGGIPMRWRSQITTYDPPHRFVDEQLLGPYSYWHHVHEFAARPDGGTDLRDRVTYGLPFGPVGELAHALVVRRQLDQIFAFRQAFVVREFGELPPAADLDPAAGAPAASPEEP